MGGIFGVSSFTPVIKYSFRNKHRQNERVLLFQGEFIRTIFDKDCEILYFSYTLTKSTTTVKHKLLFLNIFLAFT